MQVKTKKVTLQAKAGYHFTFEEDGWIMLRPDVDPDYWDIEAVYHHSGKKVEKMTYQMGKQHVVKEEEKESVHSLTDSI